MVDKKNVEYVAKLARIDITEEQKEFLSGQLSKIIDYIDKLKEVDIKDIPLVGGEQRQVNIFREDKTIDFLSKKKILSNSPSRIQNYFKVPKVIE